MATPMPVQGCLQLRMWKISCTIAFLLCLNSSVYACTRTHTHTHTQSLNIVLSYDFWINSLMHFMFYNDCIHFNKKLCLFIGNPIQSLNIILALNSYINTIINFMLCKKCIYLCRKSCLWRSALHSWSVNTFIANWILCRRQTWHKWTNGWLLLWKLILLCWKVLHMWFLTAFTMV
jgi:hypothetical protein